MSKYILLLCCILVTVKPIEGQNITDAFFSNVVHKETKSPDGSIIVNQFEVTDKNSHWYTTKLVFIELDKELYFNINDVRYKGKCDSIYNSLLDDDDLIVMSGGFFNHDREPDGLLIINNVKRSDLINWGQGGVVYSGNKHSGIVIMPEKYFNRMPLEKLENAVQSKPILIRNEKSVVSEKSSARADRIAIGTTDENSIIICLAISTKNNALSLFELSVLAAEYDKFTNGATIKSLLALDGGPYVYLKIPSLNITYCRNPNKSNYIVNVIKLSTNGRR